MTCSAEPMTRTITIIALGSRGDVQPILALGHGLQGAGYTVRIATHESQRRFVARHGFEFRLVRPDFGAMLQDQRVRDSMERGNLHMIVSFFAIVREIREDLQHMSEDMLAACRGADAIVFPKVYGSAGYYFAQALGIPAVAFALQPADPTGDFATLALPSRIDLGRWANVRSHQLAINTLAWQPYRPSANAALRRSFPHMRAPVRGPFAEMHRTRMPTLYAFSRHIVPTPSDWGHWLHPTGYWWLDEREWTPPPELMSFLAGGPPPVYIGFGSMPSGWARTTTLVLDALRATGQRGILSGRWDGLPDGVVGDSVRVVHDTPHSWLFPRMAAVVHHSGAGTTAAALRAGVPSINIPFFVDQPFWAHRIHSLGAGPAPIPLRQLSADRLAAAIRSATTDSAMRERASVLAERLRAENGVGRAVEIIESSLAR